MLTPPRWSRWRDASQRQMASLSRLRGNPVLILQDIDNARRGGPRRDWGESAIRLRNASTSGVSRSGGLARAATRAAWENGAHSAEIHCPTLLIDLSAVAMATARPTVASACDKIMTPDGAALCAAECPAACAVIAVVVNAMCRPTWPTASSEAILRKDKRRPDWAQHPQKQPPASSSMIGETVADPPARTCASHETMTTASVTADARAVRNDEVLRDAM